MNFSTFWDGVSAVTTFIVFVLIIFIGIIPATGKIMDGRVRSIYRRYTRKGRLLFVCCFLVTVVYGLQRYSDEQVKLQEQQKTEDAAAKENQRRDSIDKIREIVHQAELASTRKSIIEEFTSGLARFGLQQDSSISGRVISIIAKDTARKYNSPDLALCSVEGMKLDSIKANKYYFRISICNFILQAYSANVKAYVCTLSEDRLSIVKSGMLDAIQLVRDKYLPIESRLTSNVVMTLNNPEKIFLLVKFRFKDNHGKLISMDTIYEYDLKGGGYGYPQPPFDDLAKREFLKAGFIADDKTSRSL